MASVETIQKRIEGKKAEIARLEKKIERIQKAKDSNWEVNPYYYDERDLTYALKDLELAKSSLQTYENDLKVATEKSNSRNVKVILDFLDNWAEEVFKYYKDSVPRYIAASDEYNERTREYEAIRWKLPREERIIKEKEHREDYRNFKETWNWLDPYTTYSSGNIVLDEPKVKKDLDREKARKYDEIIEKTNAIVGQITDASGLTVGLKGDLNGYIVGTNGTASVNTIGAGGYNIQRYHFRTLIRKVK